MNLYALLQSEFDGARACLEAPDGRVWTYADLDRWSGKVAAFLAAAGVAKGERVAAQIDKSLAGVALYLGALRAGAVFVPLNTAYTAH